MNKCILSGIACWIPLALFAEVNMPTEDASKSFLLTAPGTLTGRIPGENPAPQKTTVTSPDGKAQHPLRYKSEGHKQAGESYKFPEYVQVYGRTNPWSVQGSNRGLPPPLPAARGYYSNPGEQRGRGFPGQTYQYAPRPYGYYQPQQPYNQYYGYSQDMNPYFPGGSYRDTNPASSMPFFNSMMPGLGGGDNGSHFSPFGMF